MNDQTQKFRIGLFVLGGVAVLLAMLFFFGLSNLFTHRAKVQSFFSESVQGLTVGSAVKYRGVPIGTVTRIVIRVSDKLVQVDMEVDFDTFVNNRVNGRLQQEREFRRFFQAELEQGMRCRLEYTGITGLRYIDFDYFATPGESLREPPADARESGVLYIPAVPSSFHDLLEALGTSLERISRVRFEEISDGLERSLSELSGLLADPALKSAINRINDAAENLESGTRTITRVFSENRINQFLDLLEKDLQAIDALTRQLIAESREAKIPQSTAAFRDAADAFIDGQSQLANTLEKLNQALDSLRELADYLNQDPSSLISGKKKPGVLRQP